MTVHQDAACCVFFLIAMLIFPNIYVYTGNNGYVSRRHSLITESGMSVYMLVLSGKKCLKLYCIITMRVVLWFISDETTVNAVVRMNTFVEGESFLNVNRSICSSSCLV